MLVCSGFAPSPNVVAQQPTVNKRVSIGVRRIPMFEQRFAVFAKRYHEPLIVLDRDIRLQSNALRQ